MPPQNDVLAFNTNLLKNILIAKFSDFGKLRGDFLFSYYNL